MLNYQVKKTINANQINVDYDQSLQVRLHTAN